MLDCDKAREKLYDYLDGEVNQAQTVVILDHLDRCRFCFSGVEFERVLRIMIQKYWKSVRPSMSFREEIANEIEMVAGASL